MKQKLPLIQLFRKPEREFERGRYQEQWEKGLLSNFEYLWIINQFADRSLTDVSAYPVFPWVWNFKYFLTTQGLLRPEEEDDIFTELHLRNLSKPTGILS